MATLQVRDLPPPLYQRLKREAEREHRSLTQQAIQCLRRGLGEERDPRERRRALIDSLADHLLPSEGLADPVALIREDRER